VEQKSRFQIAFCLSANHISIKDDVVPINLNLEENGVITFTEIAIFLSYTCSYKTILIFLKQKSTEDFL